MGIETVLHPIHPILQPEFVRIVDTWDHLELVVNHVL